MLFILGPSRPHENEARVVALLLRGIMPLLPHVPLAGCGDRGADRSRWDADDVDIHSLTLVAMNQNSEPESRPVVQFDREQPIGTTVWMGIASGRCWLAGLASHFVIFL